MLVRVLTATVDPADVGEANVLMRQLLQELRAQPGCAYAKLARRFLDDGSEEIVVLEEWLTPADLFVWTGGVLQRARLPEAAPGLFRDLVIAHYESLDRLPADLDSEATGVEPAQPSRRAGGGGSIYQSRESSPPSR